MLYNEVNHIIEMVQVKVQMQVYSAKDESMFVSGMFGEIKSSDRPHGDAMMKDKVQVCGVYDNAVL